MLLSALAFIHRHISYTIERMKTANETQQMLCSPTLRTRQKLIQEKSLISNNAQERPAPYVYQTIPGMNEGRPFYAKYDFHNTPSKSSSCSGVKYYSKLAYLKIWGRRGDEPSDP